MRRLNYFHEALRYYEPLQQVSDYADSSYLFELASCYRAVGLREEAEDCYKQVIDDDTGNHEARMQLAEIRQSSGAIQARYTDSHQGPTTRQHKPGKRMGKSDRKRVPLHSSNIDTTKLPTTSFIRKPPRQPMMEKQQMRDDGEIHSLFLYRQSLTEEARKRDKDCDSEWMATTELLLQDFRDNKVFYPGEKHHRFCGYSKEARAMGSRPKHELDALVARSKSTFGTRLENMVWYLS